MLLAFGTTQKPQPAVLPSRTVHVFGSTVPVDRFILAGIVVAGGDRAGGGSTAGPGSAWPRAPRPRTRRRRCSAGLSANALSMVEHAARERRWRRDRRAGRVDHPARPDHRCRSRSCPRSPPRCSRGSRRSASRARPASASGSSTRCSTTVSNQSLVPDRSGGVPLPGVKELHRVPDHRRGDVPARGERCPGAASSSSSGCPCVPRPRPAGAAGGRLAAVVCAVALVVLPFDFRQALINTLIGGVMALSLVVITGFVGQISVVQLALAGRLRLHGLAPGGRRRHRLPARRRWRGAAAAVLLGVLTAVSALRVRGVSLAVVTLGCRGGDRELRLRQHAPGAAATPARRCPSRTCSASTSVRAPRSAASTASCRARCSAGSRWS